MQTQTHINTPVNHAPRFLQSENVVRTMSSREIAELTGKRHPDVKRDIQAMAKDLKEDVSSFAHIYLDGLNRQQTEYLLDREHTDCLLTGYSASMRMAVIKRWRELEGGRVIATLPDFSNPAAAARAWAEQFELQQQANQALIEAAPKIAFVERYVESTGLKGFRQTAKLLKANESRFREFLLDKKIMYRMGGEWQAYQPHIDAGRFEVRAGTSDSGHAYNQSKFTPKGVNWVAGLWAQYKLEAQ
ncbi:phage antirepressor KilAC domain-containing protein [Pseudomonas protegens]|uniref:phage antirepressor KilAC domain-containing protein n=2 Tax=Pseudomonas protegens TaxID=380021 RepID=UPI001B311B1A|nr:phage antirepressor KilAC domain-containing protein [Pseudomonas protegens]MBP5100375.1 phage antirepressor KilAC domain-containing protein [Pseudomonas protegens]QTU06127.1 phage antirepressor KilAC domain-containing protein [Pseudomonas protegens]QTU12437.1 phage antirepressor KilAC domain-containing protein [Pseudomonas protegens]QTU40185.1 phage antirepressor KilAC domain-containing protein [Pseudomonas protegens]